MITDIDPATNAFWIANNYEAKRYEYDLNCEDTVIDIGAFNGQFALKIHDKTGCMVIAVEPTPSANHLEIYPWCEVINKAASTDNVPMKFGGSSYFTSLFLEGQSVYPCFDILELLIDKKIGLLKINVEGMEYSVLERILASGLQSNIKYFQIQFHRINEVSDSRRKELRKELGKTHKEMWCVDFCWESWEQI